MAILVKTCRNCGKRYQYYQGAALPEPGMCSSCTLGHVVLHNDDLEDEKLPS